MDTIDKIHITFILILSIVFILMLIFDSYTRRVTKEAWHSYWYPIIWITRIFKTRPRTGAPHED